MIVFVATPAEAVALPVPLTVPSAGLLGEGDDGRVVGGDGVAGGVLDRCGEDARGAGGQVRGRAAERDLGRGAVDDVERAERAGGEPGGGRLHRDGAGEDAGDRLGRDAARGGGVAGAADGARAGCLGEGDDGRVVGGDGVAGGVSDRRGQDPGATRREVGGRTGQCDLGRRAGHDVERAEGAGGEPGGRCFHRHRAGEGAGDRLGGDAAGGGRVAGPGHRAGAGGLRERDHRRVVGGDGVAGGVSDRRGQDSGRARREIGGRAGQDDVGARTVDDAERAERARREPGRGGFHRDGAGEHAGDRLGRDAGGGGGVAGAADGAGAALLRECDDGRVVGDDGVAGGVLDRRGQHPRRARGEVGGRAAERDLRRRRRGRR